MSTRKTLNDKIKQNVFVYCATMFALCSIPGAMLSFAVTGEFDNAFFWSCFFTLFFAALSFLPLLGKDGDDLLIGSGLALATGATLWVIKFWTSQMAMDLPGGGAIVLVLVGAAGLCRYAWTRKGEAWKDAVSVLSTILGVLSAVVIGVSTLK